MTTSDLFFKYTQFCSHMMISILGMCRGLMLMLKRPFLYIPVVVMVRGHGRDCNLL